jgi:hypothetical protein
MTNENFKRELGSVFDEMAGSPSSALPDRVRSSLAHVPEQRGPYWIAGVAAALIALVVIGVLFVANPLKHQPTKIVPGAGPSPTPTVPFVCSSSTTFTGQQPPLSAYVDAMSSGEHTGYDQLIIEFQDGQPQTIQLQPQTNTTFTRDGIGDQVSLAGHDGLLVSIFSGDAHTAYSGPTDIKTGFAGLLEVRVVGDFEGYVHLGLGLAVPACYRAVVLTNPTRLVIDIETGSSPNPAATLSAQCRLPVSWSEALTTSLPQEGFMDLATGLLTDVPAAHLQVAGSNLAKSPGSPTLIGWPTGSSYYDAARSRWLPALGQWISPDGGSYAYLNFDASELHTVDVATGRDQVLVRGKRLYPMAWTADGLYVMDAITGSPVQTYLVAVPGGRLTTLGAMLSSVVPVSRGGAWVAEVSTTVSHISGQNGPVANSISRIDLQSGQKVEWFSAENVAVSVLGFTQSGDVLIQTTGSAGTSIVRLSGPHAIVEFYPLAHPAVGVATDAHGTWLLDDTGGAFIYQEGAAPVLLASAPAGLIGFQLDGGCAPR